MTPVAVERLTEHVPVLVAPVQLPDEEADVLAAAAGIVNALLISLALWAAWLTPVLVYFLS